MREFNVAAIVAKIASDAAEKSQKIVAYVDMVKALEGAGVDVSKINKWDVQFCDTIEVPRHDLSKVRKVVGRLKMAGKSMAYDFDRTNEIQVTLQPMDKALPFKFAYRTKFRKGGKCEVVENVQPAYVSKSLVCKV